jgi:hypothetical protein
MGLLDDAIREHLELKRLRGADPGVVAREEQEALGPVHRGDVMLDDEHPEHPPQETPAAEDASTADAAAVPAADISATGQETAEIDMDAVFDSSRNRHEDALDTLDDRKTAPGADPTRTRVAADSSAEDSLEWEMPGDEDKQLAEHGDHHHTDGDPDDHPDDVLEETPDFLQDTPEQERLWFEQRPPRDFDFNE